ncbi:hypothetical protein Pmar_PMAR011074 [Perkinsus marinus ATCC 50983]|uniref:WAP domain-containing protein n=1 Tax=Perkinsus marinus (strain ATCC 50983 / TXsc) TaxID=423536 RepID=C5KVM6_PERM5|nr:hypothetical protein Pmar_PMAR011074 [Perkinsus marinus ATCC 50983]EER11411.1 hypothetical protein Pmar_PMAR011074 [Perkinsus marinus ATCC 50983]|eukprot:XP_002779616.1 hypothetical protein Pmar_PMAR011074 [Perkinsus marinus ATCC 50983]
MKFSLYLIVLTIVSAAELVCPPLIPGRVGICVMECSEESPCVRPGELCCSNGCGWTCKPGVTEEEYKRLADFDNRQIRGFSLMVGLGDDADMKKIKTQLNEIDFKRNLSAETTSLNVSVLSSLKIVIIKVQTSNAEDAVTLARTVKKISMLSSANIETEWEYVDDSMGKSFITPEIEEM